MPEPKTLDEEADRLQAYLDLSDSQKSEILAALQQAYEQGRAERDKEWSSKPHLAGILRHIEAEAVAEERKALLRLDQPWPLRDILSKLVDSTAHLLAEHNCDALGHEERRSAMLAAEEWLAALDAREKESEE
jgi:hypothetical protein